ncbi:hypothetical protein DICA3_C02894 [Diutina catenulata]
MASLEDQLTDEITSLSTKLVEAVQKQSEMADAMHHMQREREELRATAAKLRTADDNYRRLLPKYNRALDDVRITREAKAIAEKENTKLKGEVEDLTASLFSEANELVSNASRETYNFKVKNRKLHEELEEKDMIIASLSAQLSDVKEMLYKAEQQQKRNSLTRTNSLQRAGSLSRVPSLRGSRVGSQEIRPPSVRNSIVDEPEPELAGVTEGEPPAEDDDDLVTLLFSPSARAVRVDLNNYNHDFKGFVYTIIRPEFAYELSNLKTLRFFKRIWAEELETAIAGVPEQTSIIKNWTRSKNFWNTVCDGRAVIEPVAGVNEQFKLSYRGTAHDHGDTAPKACADPCSFCGERRNDMLEHARLYMLKLLGDTDDAPVAEYPICNFCVFKLRNLCDFFAKLRLIRSNVYKLEPSSKFDEFAHSSNNFQFKRAGDASPGTATSTSKTMVNAYTKRVALPPREEAKLMKMYMVLLQVRNRIFWSKVGVWDIPEDLNDPNIDAIPLDEFERVAAWAQPAPGADDSDAASTRSSVSFRRVSETPRQKPAADTVNLDAIKMEEEQAVATAGAALGAAVNAPVVADAAGVAEEAPKKKKKSKDGEKKPKDGEKKKKKKKSVDDDDARSVKSSSSEKKRKKRRDTEETLEVPPAVAEAVDPLERSLAEPIALDNGVEPGFEMAKDKKKKKKADKVEEPVKEALKEEPKALKVEREEAEPVGEPVEEPVVKPQQVSGQVSELNLEEQARDVPGSFAEPEPLSHLESQPEPQSEPQSELQPETQPETQPDTQFETQPETQPEPQPELQPEPQPEPQPELPASTHPASDDEAFFSSDEKKTAAEDSPSDTEHFEMVKPRKKSGSQSSSLRNVTPVDSSSSATSELEEKLELRRERAQRIIQENSSAPPKQKTAKFNLGNSAKVSDLIKKAESGSSSSRRANRTRRNVSEEPDLA